MQAQVRRSTKNGLPSRFPIPGNKLWVTDTVGLEKFEVLAEKYKEKTKDPVELKKRLMSFNSFLSVLKREGRLWRKDGSKV